MTEAETSRGVTSRTRPGAFPAALSARTAAAALAGVALVSFAVRVVFVRQVHGPFVFMDELGYEQMAKSLAQHGSIAIFGKTGSAYSPLYSLVLAPIYALTSSAHSAYEGAKVLNAALMSLSALPLYAIARSVLSRGRSLGVATLGLLAPLMFYSGLELSENLAYPVFLVAVWAMLVAVREPRPRHDALLLVAILLAAAARIQLIVLVPAAFTAVLLIAALGDGSLRRSIVSHRLLFGVTTAAAAAVLAKTLANGGTLPLAGRYASAGHARANPLRVLTLAIQHVAELDFAVGIIPFACALLAAYALVRFGFPRRALVFGAVAAATSFWLVLEVAYNAAWADHPGDPYGTPRIHERYLIYVIPLILVAMVAGLRALRPRVGARAHLAIAAIAMLLPAAIPFTKVINYTLPADTFGLQIFGTVVHGNLQAISDARLVAVCIGAVFALAYLYALIRPRPSFAIVMTVVAFLILSLLVRIRIVTNAANSTAAASTPAAWIDAAAPQPGVALISGPVRKRNAARDTAQLLYAAFDNLDVSRVYSTCGRVFGADFGERPLTAAGNGTLRDGDAPLRARYVVAPAALHVRGRVVARPADGSLELVKITTPAVTVARPLSCPS